MNVYITRNECKVMGFTHMWYTQKTINEKKFNIITHDVLKILPTIKKLGIPIAGPNGINEPIINDEQIVLNGKKNCGHTQQNIIMPWPTSDAKGVGNLNYNRSTTDHHSWPGTVLHSRICNGSCMYEPFILNRIHPKRPSTMDKGTVNQLPYFSSCKTGFRPYDIIVMVILIIAKHHLRDMISIKTDGLIDHWSDGIILTKHFLQYELDMNDLVDNSS